MLCPNSRRLVTIGHAYIETNIHRNIVKYRMKTEEAYFFTSTVLVTSKGGF